MSRSELDLFWNDLYRPKRNKDFDPLYYQIFPSGTSYLQMYELFNQDLPAVKAQLKLVEEELAKSEEKAAKAPDNSFSSDIMAHVVSQQEDRVRLLTYYCAWLETVDPKKLGELKNHFLCLHL